MTSLLVQVVHIHINRMKKMVFPRKSFSLISKKVLKMDFNMQFSNYNTLRQTLKIPLLSCEKIILNWKHE